jgi:hypothetical protein
MDSLRKNFLGAAPGSAVKKSYMRNNSDIVRSKIVGLFDDGDNYRQIVELPGAIYEETITINVPVVHFNKGQNMLFVDRNKPVVIYDDYDYSYCAGIGLFIVGLVVLIVRFINLF